MKNTFRIVGLDSGDIIEIEYDNIEFLRNKLANLFDLNESGNFGSQESEEEIYEFGEFNDIWIATNGDKLFFREKKGDTK